VINIKKWSNIHAQRFEDGEKRWVIKNLISLASELEVKEMPIEHLNISFLKPEILSMRNWVAHIKAVLEADLDYPIILDDEGYCMDGRHRIAKTLLEGKDTIKFVRFEKTPDPDYYEDEK
jgi:hypothetical protein